MTESLPKRWPDRDEIAAVREEADALQPDEESSETRRLAARWLPPGRQTMRVGPTLRALVTTPLRLGLSTAPFFAYGRAVEQLRAEVADGAHWYLAGIGVDPSAQGRGIGSALLEPGLSAAAAAGVPAVLLTNNEANLSFYERSGFVVVREGNTPENGPRAWAMVRHP